MSSFLILILIIYLGDTLSAYVCFWGSVEKFQERGLTYIFFFFTILKSLARVPVNPYLWKKSKQLARFLCLTRKKWRRQIFLSVDAKNIYCCCLYSAIACCCGLQGALGWVKPETGFCWACGWYTEENMGGEGGGVASLRIIFHLT